MNNQQEQQEGNKLIQAGDELTIRNDIIDINGEIIHEKGKKVIVRDVQSTPGQWSKICPDIYNPETINSVSLVGYYGHYNLGTFNLLKS